MIIDKNNEKWYARHELCDLLKMNRTAFAGKLSTGQVPSPYFRPPGRSITMYHESEIEHITRLCQIAGLNPKGSNG